MSDIEFFCDEDVPHQLLGCLLKLEPAVPVLKVGQPRMPPKGTKDPQLLLLAESMYWTMITKDRNTMPEHVADHLAAGHHTWGVFILRDGCSLQEWAEAMILMWAASEPKDWQDIIDFIPW